MLGAPCTTARSPDRPAAARGGTRSPTGAFLCRRLDRWRALAAVAIGACALISDACAEAPASAPDLPMLSESPLEATTAEGRYRVSLSAEPPAPRTGELFVIRTTVRSAHTDALVDGLRVQVDARMPHHGHGMVTRPEHRARGQGVYESRGMKLHMPGHWQVIVHIQTDAGRDEAVFAVDQPFGHRR